MTPITPVIANLPAEPSLLQSIEFIVSGFVFVVIVLAIIGVLTSVVGSIFKRYERPPAPMPVKKVTPVMPPPPEEDSFIPAVVAAAVFSVMGDKPHRIVQIRPMGDSWAREGRRSIQASHRVR